jgi:hypothetical protein
MERPAVKYLVKVAITYHKELTIYAPTEQEAEDKAADIVMAWNNVEDVDVLEVEEDD